MALIAGCLLLLVLGTMQVHGSIVEHELVNRLLSNYSVNVRPVEHWSEALNVTVDVSLNQIIDLNERQQFVTLLLWIRVIWKDRNMVWDPADYDGLNEIRLKVKQIWKPDIVLYTSLINFLDLEDLDDLVKIFSDGTMFWGFPKVVESLCPLNVEFFPWDTQVCVLKFGSWTYNMSQIDVYNLAPAADLNSFELNGEWEIRAMPCLRHALDYNMTNGSVFPDVTYYLVIERRPLYVIFNLVLPCIFIKATALLTFCLPPESGEKVSLNVTILLALTVFLLMVADTMPPQSFHVPLLGQYIAAVIVLLSLSTTCTVLVLRCHHRGVLIRGKMPRYVRTVVFSGLATILCMRTKVDRILEDLQAPKDDAHRLSNEPSLVQLQDEIQLTHAHFKNHSFRENGNPPNTNKNMKHEHSSSPEPEKSYLARILSSVQQLRSDLKGSALENCARGEWYLAAYLLDRFLLVVFVIITILVSGMVLCQYMYTGEVNQIIRKYNLDV